MQEPEFSEKTRFYLSDTSFYLSTLGGFALINASLKIALLGRLLGVGIDWSLNMIFEIFTLFLSLLVGLLLLPQYTRIRRFLQSKDYSDYASSMTIERNILIITFVWMLSLFAQAIFKQLL